MLEKGKATGWSFMSLAFCAFAGLATEALYAYLLEPCLYGVEMQDWTTVQYIFHWIITCITWGIITVILVVRAKRKYDFDIFEAKLQMKAWQGIVVILSVLLSLTVSYWSWDGFKVIKEFQSNGLLKFVFQYIYYIFETGLFTLIIVFGQRAFEKWFQKENFPFGGIAVALTWGVAHIFTKDILTGILATIIGFIFGAVYLLTNRDIKKTFLILLIMFVL